MFPCRRVGIKLAKVHTTFELFSWLCAWILGNSCKHLLCGEKAPSLKLQLKIPGFPKVISL